MQTKDLISQDHPLTTSKMSNDKSNDADKSLEEQVASLNLQLLNLELPDAGQDIVEQNLGRPLETFTCFKELPFELRLLIWDYMLPRRRVVDFRLIWGIFYRSRKFQPTRGVGLSVNHESRNHFLKHYSIFFQGSYSFRKRKTRIFCLDPKVDLVRVDSEEVLGDHSRSRLARLFGQNPDCLAKVSSVEITGVEWNFLQQQCEGSLVSEATPCHFFEFFTGLKTIHLTESSYSLSWWRDTICQVGYNALVELAKDKRPARLSEEALPTIVMHKYRRSEARSDHDYLFDKAMTYPWNRELPAILQPPQPSQTSDS
ncbi:hypothetical protein DL98DRAFT_643579 [Cadophora sp. DSE1049]|nr:hypothetical protein DL98DRAFT_643579 [Cadophora sp. DSE1049]